MTGGHCYLDSCVVLSLFLGDSAYATTERWVFSQAANRELWISHWVLLEFTGVLTVSLRRGDISAARVQAIHTEFEAFRKERLSLLEPRSNDFLQARHWLQQNTDTTLRAADALHLAMAQRHDLVLITADVQLAQAASRLGQPHECLRPTQP